MRSGALLVLCAALLSACSTAPRAIPAKPAQKAPPPPSEVELYRIDSEASSVSATASAVMGRYTFRFPRFSGSIEWAPREIEKTRIELDVDMTSVTGSVEMVTNIVRSEDFLDVANHPSASFLSGALANDGDGRGRVRGELELRGVRRYIEVPGSFRFEGERLRIESEFRIDRREYGIENDGALDALVGDDVTVRLDLVAQRTRAVDRSGLPPTAERRTIRAP